MGVTLGRLVIFDFNTSIHDQEKNKYFFFGSIDFAESDPTKEAEEKNPFTKMLESSGWRSKDTIVRIIAIPSVTAPFGFVHNEPDIKVTVSSSENSMKLLAIDKIFLENTLTNKVEMFEFNIKLPMDD